MKVWEVIISGIIWDISLQNKNIGSRRIHLIGLRHETIVKRSDACAIACSSTIVYKNYERQNSYLVSHPEAVKWQAGLSSDSIFPYFPTISLWHLADQKLPKSCLWHLAFGLCAGFPYNCLSHCYSDYESYSIFMSASRCILVGAVTVDKILHLKFNFLKTSRPFQHKFSCILRGTKTVFQWH